MSVRPTFSFADELVAANFPAHGYATNNVGVCLLWLPFVGLLSRHSHGTGNATAQPLSAYALREIASYSETTRKLCISLRELHSATYGVRWTSVEEPVSAEELSKRHRAIELTPLLVDLAVVYLRRSADDLARAARHLLFAHPESAPTRFKVLRRIAAEPESISRLGPFVDAVRLAETLRDRSNWYTTLTERTSSVAAGRKGIRDALEHQASTLQVSYSQVGNAPWLPHVDIIAGSGSVQQYGDLLTLLKEIVCEYAEMLTALTQAAALSVKYEPWTIPYGDCQLMVGEDADSVGFWPAIARPPQSAV